MSLIHTKIIGISSAVRNIRRRARRAGETDCNVMLYGEAGTEKESVARLIHEKGFFPEKTFLALDAYLLNDNSKNFESKIRDFTEGTLFIDNFDQLCQNVQNSILIMIRSGRLASGESRSLRIIGAVSSEKYRSNPNISRETALVIDQYSIEIPPLRERKSDILPLFNYYFELFSNNDDCPGINEDTARQIMSYDWPGNTAEIINSARQINTENSDTQPESLSFIVRKQNSLSHLEHLEYSDAIKHVDKFLVETALIKSGWNQTKAAQLLNISEGTIRQKMRKLSILRP